jgi:hypothetical protein
VLAKSCQLLPSAEAEKNRGWKMIFLFLNDRQLDDSIIEELFYSQSYSITHLSQKKEDTHPIVEEVGCPKKCFEAIGMIMMLTMMRNF